MPDQLLDSEASAPADGRYLGKNNRWWVEVRVDTRGSHRVSADLHSDGADHEGFYASIRTVTDVSSPVGQWDAEWVSAQGTTVAGSLALRPMPGSTTSLTIELHCAEDLDGLPASRTVTIAGAVWVGPELRVIGVETEVEDGVAELQSVRFKDAEINFKECLGRAGFAVHEVGEPTSIPAREDGWNSSDIFSELSQVMHSSAQASLDKPAWEVHLMLLSHTKRDDLCGVMFDPEGTLPRQGAAVFVDEIRKRVPKTEEADRQIVQTVVHEIGHALNLGHRFGPQIRRSNSTSFMNYDWRYLGGQHVKNYWEGFTYTFDEDELRHLRHAPRAQIIPGGSCFGSARYWSTENLTHEEGYWNDLRLWLTPPIAGPTFAFGQPVFLEVSLLNAGCHPVHVPRHVLDIKAGQLDVLIRPCTPAQDSTSGAFATKRPFSPIMQRCFAIDSSGLIELKRGESLHTNMNLTYGSGGFSFPDPGAYEITPILTFPASAEDAKLDHVIQGAPLRIRVTRPQDSKEEREVETVLRRSDVGMSIALGGADCLQVAADELEEVRARRERETHAGRADPVVAAIVRAAGIHAGRRGKVRQAARLLSQATSAEAITAFDPHTAEHTRRLAARYAAETYGEEHAPTVVVDLWTPPRAGLPTQGGRVCGLMIAAKPEESESPHQKGAGWAVLAPADHLPPEVMTKEASVHGAVVAATDDGLSERLSVSRIDLIGPAGPVQKPVLAFLWLARSVPADPTPELPGGTSNRVLSRGDLWEVLVQSGARTDMATLRGEPLDQWASAADEAMADVSGPVTALDDPKVSVKLVDDFDDLALWVCDVSPICLPGKPPEGLEKPYPPSAVTKHQNTVYETKCEPCSKKRAT